MADAQQDGGRVNNAGVGDDGTLEDLSSEAVRRLVEVNLMGTLSVHRAGLARRPRPDGGPMPSQSRPGFLLLGAVGRRVLSRRESRL